MERLLLGPPLCDRAGYGHAQACAELDAVLERVAEFVPRLLGPAPAAADAAVEIRRVTATPPSLEGVQARRALLLWCVRVLPEVGDAVAARDAAGAALGARDMQRRVLPFCASRYARTSFQAPDSFALTCALLGSMWAGETLGSFSR